MEEPVQTVCKVRSPSFIHKLEQGLKRRRRFFLGFLFKIYLWLHGCEVGRNLACYSIPRLRSVPNKNIQIGDHVTFGYNCTLEVEQDAEIVIGHHANITQNVLIASNTRISIGAYTLVGENVSIRDGNHSTSKDYHIAAQEMHAEPVHVDDDVWLGAFSLILKGAHVPKGAVIGGHSVVSQSSNLEPYGIYVGAPVRFLKWRGD